ncbi:hypothetical protein HBB16_02380 [Pseudonocardia sp. MCCB 268]|nr:hypothetical protein [Pseudonocardia cytotoxica]
MSNCSGCCGGSSRAAATHCAGAAGVPDALADGPADNHRSPLRTGRTAVAA